MQVRQIAGVALLAGAVRQSVRQVQFSGLLTHLLITKRAFLSEPLKKLSTGGSALRVLHKCGSGLLAAARH